MIPIPEEIEAYAERHSRGLSPLHDLVWKETHEKTKSPKMMVGALEGALLRLLVRITAAKRVLEIGMFTGYSALAWAEALPEDGRLVTCDTNPDTTEIAKRYFAASPHGHKIEVRLGPALETVKTLRGPFDICFIDADKPSYGAYYEACLELTRPRGLIILDNMMQKGNVLNPSDEKVRGIDALNKRVLNDPRVENVLLPIRDGIMLACKL
ncbi:MAG TPA: class I SAM-dependent methyltransferase [Verrucomicrobiae bacterium]|jgi:caffeoyl-CoA O-methyltransferase|nr:class I SAM-dependent methyltransferase [Verrucomicrobiae bacterium]